MERAWDASNGVRAKRNRKGCDGRHRAWKVENENANDSSHHAKIEYEARGRDGSNAASNVRTRIDYVVTLGLTTDDIVKNTLGPTVQQSCTRVLRRDAASNSTASRSRSAFPVAAKGT